MIVRLLTEQHHLEFLSLKGGCRGLSESTLVKMSQDWKSHALAHILFQNIVLPHRSSLLVGVLMLCGIKPDILLMYNKIMGYVTAASEDFAMFFFAFLMSHIFV